MANKKHITILEKVYKLYFLKNMSFFNVVKTTGICSYNLKSKIVRIALNHSENRSAIKKYINSKGMKFNPYHYDIDLERLTLITNEMATVEFLGEKIYNALFDYNRIPDIVVSETKRGIPRAVICKRLGIDLCRSYAILPVSECIKKEKPVQNEEKPIKKPIKKELSPSEKNALQSFEKSWFKGRIITQDMKNILIKAGKLKEYESKSN